jgi:signal transduction histidine kinase
VSLSAKLPVFNRLFRRTSCADVRWEDEREQLVNIFRAIVDAVLLLDANGTVRFCNEEALERLGLPGGGVAQNRGLGTLLSADHPLVEIVNTAKASGTELRDIAAEVGHGDAKLTFLVSVFPLGVDPAQAGQLVLVRDLKSVHQLPDLVNSLSGIARIGGIFSGVSHQIRNPLNAMTLELELLSQDVRDGKPVDERVQMVRRDMAQVAKAIDTLTRFTRAPSLKPELVKSNEFVSEAARIVTDPKITIALKLDPSDPTMKVDRAVVMEALCNVIQNAMESMPNGGALEITTERIDDFVEVTLADTGHGIPAEILDRVMQLYFTTKEYGTGVGLPMALRAVDLHGGTLSLDSRMNVGTVVSIRLPADHSTPCVATPHPQAE